MKPTPKTSPSQRLPTETRQAEIVDAALRLAQDRGPASITTTALANVLGLSQGALFKHFPSKESIWLGVMTWVTENLLQTLEQAAQQSSAPLEALHCVFNAHVGFVATHPGVPRVIFNELQQSQDSPLKQLVRSQMQGYGLLLRRLLHAAVRSGDARQDLDEAAAATLFVGIVQGLVMQSMLTGQISSMQEKAPGVFQLYLRSIRVTP